MAEETYIIRRRSAWEFMGGISVTIECDPLTYGIISVAAGIVGRDGLEPDAWYRCVGGKLVPSQQEGAR